MPRWVMLEHNAWTRVYAGPYDICDNGLFVPIKFLKLILILRSMVYPFVEEIENPTFVQKFVRLVQLSKLKMHVSRK